MDRCPRCGREVDQLHPLPAEVLTRDLVEVLGGPDAMTHLEACGGCIDELMEQG